jgi:hypothetical protein
VFACPIQFGAPESVCSGCRFADEPDKSAHSPTGYLFMHARTISAVALMLAILGPWSVRAEDDITQGTLIWRDDSCFFFVLKTPEGFGLYEFLGGPSPLVGNVFEGKLTGFGGRKLMNVTAGKPTMAYSETFTDSKRQMEKKIPRQCRKKKEFEALDVQ